MLSTRPAWPPLRWTDVHERRRPRPGLGVPVTAPALQGDREPAEPAMTARAGVLRGGLWSAASQILPAAGTAVLSVAAGRVLGSGPLGQQSLIAYVNAALSSVLVVSLNLALLQVGGRLQGERDYAALRSLARWAVSAHLAIGALVLAIMAASGEVVGDNRLAWAVVGGVSLLDAAADGMCIRLVLAEGWGPIGRLRLVFQFIGPFLGVAFLLAGGGIVGIFLGDGVAALGLLLAVLPRFRRMGADVLGVAPPEQPVTRRPSPTPRHRPRPGREPRPPGRHAVPAGSRWRPPVPVLNTVVLFSVGALITQVVSKRVEFLVLAGFSGDVAVGMYSVAFIVVSLLSMVPMGVATAAMPLIAAAEGRGEITAATRHLMLALRLGTALTIPVTALVAALGPSAILFVYGSEYHRAAVLVPYSSAALLVATVIGVCTQFWSGRGQLGVVLRTGAVAAVVDVGVALILVPHFADAGAVAANLSGQLALAVGLLVATVRRMGPVGWQARSLLAAVLVGLTGAAAVVVVVVGLDHLVSGGELRSALTLAVGAPISLAATAAACLVFRLFDQSEAEWLRPMMPGRATAVLERLTRPAR